MTAPFDITQWIPAHVAEAFSTATRVRQFTKGEALYVQGDSSTEMYRILSGSVRLGAGRSDGREMLYLLLERGDCFGDSSLVDLAVRPQTAEAQSDVEVQVLTRAAYLQLRAAHHEIDEALLQLLSR